MNFHTVLTIPSRQRVLLFRRVIAGLLLVIAGILLWQSIFNDNPTAVVMVKDVPAGTKITASDLELQAIPTDFLPQHAFRDNSEVIGKITAAPISAGEIATAPRFIGNELINSFVSNISEFEFVEPFTMVPLRLADPSIIPLLEHGDTISVISQDPQTELAQTIAAGGRVILAEDSDTSTVLIALPESAANLVAAASLATPMAVVLTGDRSG